LAFKHLTFIWNLDFDIWNWLYVTQCYLDRRWLIFKEHGLSPRALRALR
jgi:hypothetical protein